jgi:quercetin dioxygenase-like cupin family protein
MAVGAFRIIQGFWNLGDEPIESYFVRDMETLPEAQQLLLQGKEGNGMFRIVNSEQVTVFSGQNTEDHADYSDPRIEGLAFFRALEVGGHSDYRREITDVVIPWHDPFQQAVHDSRILQTKIVTMSQGAVDQKMVVGNHYHVNDRHELFVVRGPEDRAVFTFTYALPNSDVVGELEMRNGDACYIPPGITHAFTALASGATLVGFSNLAYDSDDDVVDKIA